MAAQVVPTMGRKFVGSALLGAATAAAIGMAVAPVAAADTDDGPGKPVLAAEPPPIPVPWWDNTNAIWFDPGDLGKIAAGNANTFGWDELSSFNGISAGWADDQGIVGNFAQTFTVPAIDHDTFPDGWPIGLGVQWHVKSLTDHELTIQCEHGNSVECPWQPGPGPIPPPVPFERSFKGAQQLPPPDPEGKFRAEADDETE
jgi:hypothetical protein